jgi:hypothetical protein
VLRNQLEELTANLQGPPGIFLKMSPAKPLTDSWFQVHRVLVSAVHMVLRAHKDLLATRVVLAIREFKVSQVFKVHQANRDIKESKDTKVIRVTKERWVVKRFGESHEVDGFP